MKKKALIFRLLNYGTLNGNDTDVIAGLLQSKFNLKFFNTEWACLFYEASIRPCPGCICDISDTIIYALYLKNLHRSTQL